MIPAGIGETSPIVTLTITSSNRRMLRAMSPATSAAWPAVSRPKASRSGSSTAVAMLTIWSATANAASASPLLTAAMALGISNMPRAATGTSAPSSSTMRSARAIHPPPCATSPRSNRVSAAQHAHCAALSRRPARR